MAVASRALSFISYADPKDIESIIKSHIASVRGFAYIVHDRDEGEITHTHFVIKLYQPWKPKQVAKWFENCVDSQGNAVNTFGECVSDTSAIALYLTHSDKESRMAGKFQYEVHDIVDFGLNEFVDRRVSADNTFEILLAMLRGVPYLNLVRSYGKDFVYHYVQYSSLLNDMRLVEIPGSISREVARYEKISTQLNLDEAFKK